MVILDRYRREKFCVKSSFIFLFSLALMLPNAFAQNRQELITEYRKMRTNDGDLGITVGKDLENATTEEIRNAVNKAWVRKKLMILLQLLGFWENPVGYPVYMKDNDYREKFNEVKRRYGIKNALIIANQTVAVLERIYISSGTDNFLPQLMRDKEVPYTNAEFYIRVFKKELRVELFAREKNANEQYKFIKSYTILNSIVANLGPKMREGDCLTPEGFYDLIYGRAWRWSDFYLAFRVSYPNRADRIRRKYWQTDGGIGGAINFHGCSASIGCIPIGNFAIEEVFMLLTKSLGRNNIAAKIYIFPFDFSIEENKNLHEEHRRTNLKLAEFWDGLKEIYEYFETNQRLPEYDINNRTGYYKIRKENE